MDTPSEHDLSGSESEEIAIRASQVFSPSTPISTRELFAGRGDKIASVIDTVSQVGLHAVIFGERGVGKTSLANIIKPFIHFIDEGNNELTERIIGKVNSHADDTFSGAWKKTFDEVLCLDEREVFGFGKENPNTGTTTLTSVLKLPEELTIDNVRKTLARLPKSVFIFDEFDRIKREEARRFTDLIKALSDFAVDTTLILVGVSDTVDDLITDHMSIGRALTQVEMPRMQEAELNEILKKGEAKLGVTFDDDARKTIVRMSLGLPHYTHLVGQHAVRVACDRQSSKINKNDVSIAINRVVNNTQHSIVKEYDDATRSAHKDALYGHVLLACAITASQSIDEQGYFQATHVAEALSAILPVRKAGISIFNKHLAQFCEQKRGFTLEKTGAKRGYRYRFKNPLLPPYVIMKGLSLGLITTMDLSKSVGSKDIADISSSQMKLF